jgi:uncharacterized protein
VDRQQEDQKAGQATPHEVVRLGRSIREGVRLMRSLAGTVFLAWVALLSGGCAGFMTFQAHYPLAEQNLAQGNYEAAAALMRQNKECYTAKNAVLFYLDVGMLEHYAGNVDASNAMLTQAERGIEDNYTKSASRGAAGLLLNDNTFAYAGEDYENAYVNIFKALNYLSLGKSDSAFVEVRRINNKLVMLRDRYAAQTKAFNEEMKAQGQQRSVPKSHFQESALGRYLSLVLYRRDGKFDDARIDLNHLRSAWKLQPGIYDFQQPRLPDCLTPLRADRARLTVIGFTGQAPIKQAETLHIYTLKNQVVISHQPVANRRADKSATVIPWKDMKPGNNFKFSIPKLIARGSRVAQVRVIVDDKAEMTLEQIESLENAARETFRIRQPMILMRTGFRVLMKGIAMKQARDEIRKKSKDDGAGDFLAFLATETVMAMEIADCRISRFFPARAYVGEIDVTPGKHNVRVEYYGANKQLLYKHLLGEVELCGGNLNVMESVCIQ